MYIPALRFLFVYNVSDVLGNRLLRSQVAILIHYLNKSFQNQETDKPKLCGLSLSIQKMNSWLTFTFPDYSSVYPLGHQAV